LGVMAVATPWPGNALGIGLGDAHGQSGEEQKNPPGKHMEW
jgi:hypothetical protein